MTENAEKIVAYIKENKLMRRDRKRNVVDTRTILVKWLRKEGLTLQKIGSILKRNHATVLNMERNYDILIVIKEFQYLEARLRKDLELFDYEEVKESEELKERILGIRDYWQMVKLQNELKANLR